MKVSVADFSYKQQKEVPKAEGKNGKAGQSSAKEKKKIIKKTQKLNKYSSIPSPILLFPLSTKKKKKNPSCHSLWART